MSSRALRMMQKFSVSDILKAEDGAPAGAGGSNATTGGTIAPSTSASTNVGSDGSLSQLGSIPTGPLRKNKRKNHEAIICNSCGYPSISEAIICSECGTRLQNEDVHIRSKRYRENLIEGKTVTEARNDWVLEVAELFMSALGSHENLVSLDEADQTELKMRIEITLNDFADYRVRKQTEEVSAN